MEADDAGAPLTIWTGLADSSGTPDGLDTLENISLFFLQTEGTDKPYFALGGGCNGRTSAPDEMGDTMADTP